MHTLPTPVSRTHPRLPKPTVSSFPARRRLPVFSSPAAPGSLSSVAGPHESARGRPFTQVESARLCVAEFSRPNPLHVLLGGSLHDNCVPFLGCRAVHGISGQQSPAGGTCRRLLHFGSCERCHDVCWCPPGVACSVLWGTRLDAESARHVAIPRSPLPTAAAPFHRPTPGAPGSLMAPHPQQHWLLPLRLFVALSASLACR